MKKVVICLMTVLMCLGLCACGDIKAERSFFAMDTYITVTAYGKNGEKAVQAAQELMEGYDALWSIGEGNSAVSRLNRGERISLDRDTSALLDRSLEISHMTQGAFDPLMLPVMELWGFTDKHYAVPSEDDIKKALSLTDVQGLHLENGTAYLTPEGCKADLGGIAKGYASGAAADMMREMGVSSGILSLGGNIRTIGEKPDGSPWRVAVRMPFDEGFLGIVEVRDKAVVTSGGYERYFEENGKLYHHIIDPKTGCPADSGLMSVTVVSGDDTLADALSTALFVMGKEQAEEFWQEHEGFDLILLCDDGSLYITEGIKDDFTSDMEYEVISNR